MLLMLGLMVAIMTVRLLPMKESFSTWVSLEPAGRKWRGEYSCVRKQRSGGVCVQRLVGGGKEQRVLPRHQLDAYIYIRSRRPPRNGL